MVASSSVPVVFEPIKAGERLLVDGGVLNNFPVEPLLNICDVIIGSYVNKLDDGLGNKSIFKTFTIMDRCFHLAIANAAYSKANKCNVFIDAPMHGFDMYDVKKADMIFEIGYQTALQYKDAIIKNVKDSLPVI